MKLGPLDPVDVTFKVANDGQNVYVLLEVPGDFDYDPANHNLSGSVAVMFRGDGAAAPHLGGASARGGSGPWIFEMSRPLQPGDPQDGQFASGSTAYVALAFFDPN